MLQVGDIIIGKNCIHKGIYYPFEQINNSYIKEMIYYHMLILDILEKESEYFINVIYLQSNKKETFKYDKKHNYLLKESIQNYHIYFDYEIISDK